MRSIDHLREFRPSPDLRDHPTSKPEHLARAVQVGLMIYLLPMIVLVAAIGSASLVIQALSRLVLGPRSDPAMIKARSAAEPLKEQVKLDGVRRRTPLAH